MSDNKILQAILDGQVQIKKDIKDVKNQIQEVDRKVEDVGERVTKLGLQIAGVKDDSPSYEEFDNSLSA